MSNIIQKSSLQFLKDIKVNNNREWFTEHKATYLTALDNIKAFQANLLDKMSTHDEIESSKLFRIYRDVRFSKNKIPYKSSFSGSFVRATKFRRGGYYFHLEPDHYFIAGGFWQPNAPDLKRIRTEIVNNAEEYRKILADPAFVESFGSIEGDQVKTAPRGFDKDDPAIDLLRFKQHIVVHRFKESEICKANFVDKVNDYFQEMRPFLDFMTNVLTTDENGVPLE